MSRFISIACLIGGIILIVFGIRAADSFSSDLSNFFTGNPTDEAIWMLVGGVVLIVIAGFGVFRKS
ncbi:MAG: DUF3185 family protein [Opitutales bacterium]